MKVCNYAEIKGYNSTSTGNYIGGICSQNHGIVQQCKNEGKIWNANNAIGGIVGLNYQTVKECANKGRIDANVSASYHLGGIAGRNNGEIYNCYNLGSITGQLVKGGIVGPSDGNIKNCYSIADITTEYQAGGIVSTNSGKVTNCWYVKKGNYDIQLSTSTGTVETSGEKTEAEMKDNAFLNVLNAGNDEVTWKLDRRKNNGYPYLAWEDE